ncbi:hypothetical protein M527_07030 [Sphingobium indicum IP26]|uniref:Uncharacterized protein n=1 Tax=Sphingobium indicum F2 TaxID=1450518 RepID=A0A8E1C2W7_9SPHN|nr:MULTISPECIES: hypothetical protein [Sphingobium]EPR09874.1 hypothetical protein M527_07030 [Sphingobium indicum IP26]EQB05002.1 hypothetical protein L286_09545 [Sphingobium sp. HDIP04]KER36667.1 hypothetical protein AL00_09335 [Sphingobium indicum F2]
MKSVFTIDYDDGKVRAAAGDDVPAAVPSHRQRVLRRAGVIKAVDPLDHDANGRKGGSRPRTRRKAKP